MCEDQRRISLGTLDTDEEYSWQFSLPDIRKIGYEELKRMSSFMWILDLNF